MAIYTLLKKMLRWQDVAYGLIQIQLHHGIGGKRSVIIESKVICIAFIA
jgi:hypothetical protein